MPSDAQVPVSSEDAKSCSAPNPSSSTEISSTPHFNLWSALGIQYSLTAAPLALGLYLSLNIGLGGAPVFVWGFIFVGFMQLPVCLVMAELASAIPHASGPAYWAVRLAPPQVARPVGYLMGFLSMAAWIFILASTFLYLAQVLMALVEVCQPEFRASTWQIYLLYVAFATLALVSNLPWAFNVTRHLLFPTILLINATAIYLIAMLLVRANPKQSARTVFMEFVNVSGWSSDGLVFFLGLMPAVSVLALFDNATHITNELETPAMQVPQIMIGSFCLSYFTGIPMTIIYQLCNVNTAKLLNPVGGQPIVQLIFDAANSKALAIIPIAAFLICFTMASNAVLISASRLYWSLSLNGGLPLSRWTSKVSSSDHLPLNGLCFVTVVVICLGTISLASSTAMNAILSASSSCMTVSYVTTFVFALRYGRENLASDRWLNLGPYGDLLYIFSIVWQTFIGIIMVFPLYQPVTLSNMNYGSVIVVGIAVLTGTYWVLRARHTFSL